jgi:transcriptional regulator with XRE-family HTH domain
VITPNPPAYAALGAFVRSQRELARLTLRQAAELARISNPYLSQIEHGMALPSVTVLTDLANALSVSTEMLLLRAAGVEPVPNDAAAPRTEDAIRHDPRLTDTQRKALLGVLRAFTAEPIAAAAAHIEQPAAPRKAPNRKALSTKPKEPGATTVSPVRTNNRKRVTS